MKLFARVGRWLAVAAVLPVAGAALTAPADAGTAVSGKPGEAAAHARSATPTFCLNAHLANIGWQGWRCGSATWITVGTTGQSRRMEALRIRFGNSDGYVCAEAHLANIGWQGARCGLAGQLIEVGTTGQSRAMEAIRLYTSDFNICLDAHLAGIGWQGTACAIAPGTLTRGTTGQSRPIEALNVLAW
ncbi:hypothetical protein [Streptosporangium carneum]|uniref:Hydrophobic W protein n=1 Tax=Streptosporangium carneum TaxID=47481 RepID=A0A9W6I7D5_9ACTN|nr:hypothetical protein [Streptosporangium carneum]GLK13441.1 hypothetical protein GCM10017600_68520 [Streptosporangium carneum]